MNKEVLLLIGAGQIGMVIARRMGYGKKIVVGDCNVKNAITIYIPDVSVAVGNPARVIKYLDKDKFKE